jgi:hypothetical protein
MLFSLAPQPLAKPRHHFLQDHLRAEAAAQLLLDHRPLADHEPLMEIGLAFQALGHALERRVHRDVRVGDEQHRATRAVVRLDDAREGRGLAGARRAPDEGRVAAERAAQGAHLVRVEGAVGRDGRVRLGVRGSWSRLTDRSFGGRAAELRLAAADLFQALPEPLDQERIVRDQASGRDLGAEVLLERHDEQAVAEGDDHSLDVFLARDDADRRVVAEVQILGHGEPVEPRALSLPRAFAAAELDLGAAALLADRGDLQAERLDHR